MKEIIFKKNFKKLHNQEFGLLFCIKQKSGKELNKDFIEYDTENNYKVEDEQQYLILYFIGDKLIPFTTLRKYNDENILKYRSMDYYKFIVEE